MSIIDSIIEGFKRILGGGAPKPQPPRPRPTPPADDILPLPRTDPAPRPTPDPAPQPRPAPVPAPPVATLTLGKDQASVASQGGQSRQGTYRRPPRVASGTYMARREGGGISLYQGGSRVSTVYPYEQAGVNDLGLQILTWQMLMNAVESQNDATVRIDDQHPGDTRTDDADLDLDGLPDLDLSQQTQREQDAVTALGVLGFDTVGPADAKPAQAPDRTGAETAPVEVRTEPAPEPTPLVPPPPTVDSWSPSGAYER